MRRANSAPVDQRRRLIGLADAARPALALRSRLILKYLDGQTPAQIAREFGISPQTVRKWRKRYLEAGVAGLGDRPRPGRPRRHSPETLRRLIRRLLQQPPPDGRRWSVRRVAETLGLSKATVGRAWKSMGAASAPVIAAPKAPHRAGETECGRDVIIHRRAARQRIRAATGNAES